MEIYDHDSSESITYKNNTLELQDWFEHLQYIDKEIENLLKLGSSNVPSTGKVIEILQVLEEKKLQNTQTIDELSKYRNDLPNAAECEDVSCDMFYINEHDRCRKLFKNHLKSYRQLKEDYFKILNS